MGDGNNNMFGDENVSPQTRSDTYYRRQHLYTYVTYVTRCPSNIVKNHPVPESRLNQLSNKKTALSDKHGSKLYYD